MPWYIDISTIVLSVIILSGDLKKIVENALNQSVTTKDGYKINLSHLIKIYEKSDMVVSAPIAYLAIVLDTKRFGWKFVSSVAAGLLLAYWTVGQLFESFFSIPNLVIPIAGACIIVSILGSRLKTDIQRVVNDSEELLIETPDSYKRYGQYLSNPYDARSRFEELKELEGKMDIAFVNRDDYSIKSARLSNFDKSIWNYYERIVEHDASQLFSHIKYMTQTLFTDTPPGEIQSVIKTKLDTSSVNSSNPGKVIVMDKTNPLPPHIQEMRTIASSPTLPKEVTNQAKEIFDTFAKKERERAQKEQLEIDNAMIAIHTVKRYYEEEHRL